ncbi:MAG: thiol-disulfide oxidoreductase DCC family protein [Planctomycetaceae bacterium]
MPDTSRATTESHRDADFTSESANHAYRPILFYDGVCGLCNHTIDFVIRRDRRRVFRFAPLQGETARQLLDSATVRDLNTFVYLDAKRECRRSAAVVRVLWNLGGIWKMLAALLWIIPLPLRDLGYRIVSASRYRLFGKKEVCRIPAPEERVLFLD